MKRVRLTVAYDGTNYCGWQLQKKGETIEGVLNRELTALLKEPIAVTGASRTDAGVHSLGNVAIFDTNNRMAADKICLAVNQSLPEDIRVQSSEEVSLFWHPRKANCTKIYEYRILNRRIPLPTQRLYAYFCYYPLDVERMRQGAALLVGEHNFKSFCTAKSNVEDTVRTIYHLDIEKDGECIVIRISGSGFLYNMVRIIAGTLMQVGKGALLPEEVAAILAARDRRRAGPTAPAAGLTLVGMTYEKELCCWQHSENEDWEYYVLQSHIKKERTAYFLILRCRDEDWERLILRNVHHAFQNGATRVFAVDLEKERLRENARFGYYRINEVGRQALWEAMTLLDEKEKALIQEICGRAKEKNLREPVWYCGMDEKALKMADKTEKSG
ncbi:MAG: tRNA pseudouridine(38-40) synthase TruA [Lachnospiraceae bacterium]|jgi:tRNA pseudouridine38-40 synthase|nr:tRNA pseudouridine(38-40) synthase TruA [Lachnospiraceae bacterium]